MLIEQKENYPRKLRSLTEFAREPGINLRSGKQELLSISICILNSRKKSIGSAVQTLNQSQSLEESRILIVQLRRPYTHSFDQWGKR
jgi:hypothetical protein